MKTKRKLASNLTLNDIVVENEILHHMVAIAWTEDGCKVHYTIDINKPMCRVCDASEKITVLV